MLKHVLFACILLSALKGRTEPVSARSTTASKNSSTTDIVVIYSNKRKCIISDDGKKLIILHVLADLRSDKHFSKGEYNEMSPVPFLTIIIPGIDGVYRFYVTSAFEYIDNHFKLTYGNYRRYGYMRDVNPVYAITNYARGRGCKDISK